MLKGKNILLGITGSIAAYKSIDLSRRLVEEGAEVTVIMTESACRFIQPLSFESVLGKRVCTDLFDRELKHISLAKDAHLLLIAPATANTISKISCGIADNLLSTACLVHRGPFLIAPAMNSRMYQNSIFQRNIRILKKEGFNFIGPESGSLACGEEGAGRMAEVPDIIEAVKTLLGPGDLSGHKILVTAGPTREPLDPVRYFSNRSSGKMGFAIASAALRRGADVTLISGPTSLKPPKEALFIPVERSVEMEKALLKHFHRSTSVIMAAAVSDFSPSSSPVTKLPKTGKTTINLQKTSDILKKIGRKKGRRTIIGFAAETGQGTKKAKAKLKEKNLDFIVLNDITKKGAGFDVDTNIVTIIDKKNTLDYPLMKKDEVADIILDKILQISGKH